jgi:hypothetical protein
MKQEHEGYEEYKQHIVIWKKQKKATKEKVNAKMLQLTTKNKELKMRMMEWIKLQKECQELKKREEVWNDTNHAY